jgi:hypothetical protein
MLECLRFVLLERGDELGEEFDVSLSACGLQAETTHRLISFLSSKLLPHVQDALVEVASPQRRTESFRLSQTSAGVDGDKNARRRESVRDQLRALIVLKPAGLGLCPTLGWPPPPTVPTAEVESRR